MVGGFFCEYIRPQTPTAKGELRSGDPAEVK